MIKHNYITKISSKQINDKDQKKLLTKLKNIASVGPLKNDLIYFITEDDSKKLELVQGALKKLKLDINVEVIDVDVKYATVECDINNGEIGNCSFDGVSLCDSYEEACESFLKNSFSSDKAYKLMEFALDTTPYPAERTFKDVLSRNDSNCDKCRRRILFANTLKVVYPVMQPWFNSELPGV